MTRALLLLAVAAASFALATPGAQADTTCQAVDTTSACVTTDTDGTPGVAVQVGPACVVVLASCS
jgi:hypothetical protein